MIYLFTGQPGSQKTANMIHFVLSDEQFQNRPVFFYNITDCQIDDWQELSEEEILRWYELPEGSVILIDEAQTIFRPQKWDKEKSRTVTELETHRHHGFDIIMTTQHPMLINADVRRQVQQHRHYKKPFGLKSVCMTWERCISDPTDKRDIKEAQLQSGTVPADVFDLYKSTVLNTHKKRVPKKLVVFFVLVALLLGLSTYFGLRIYDRVTDDPVISDSTSQSESVIESGTVLNSLDSGSSSDGEFRPIYPLDPMEYAKIWEPRIPGVPNSAPVYDELVRPTVAPKVRCYGYHRDGDYHCKCVTQQMTPVNMPYEQCVSVVNDGMWDPAPITSATYDSSGRIM